MPSNTCLPQICISIGSGCPGIRSEIECIFAASSPFGCPSDVAFVGLVAIANIDAAGLVVDKIAQRSHVAERSNDSDSGVDVPWSSR